MKTVTSILALFVLCVASAFAAQSDRITSNDGRVVQMSNGVHPQANPRFDKGAVAPNMRVHLMLQTPPGAAQRAAIDKLIAQQTDKHSPLYHHWLTPEQYGARYGLSDADAKRLTGWLSSQGFKVDLVARGRDFIKFSGTASQVKAAFGTELHTFSRNGVTYYANTARPSIPAAFSSVVTGIRGLNNFGMKPNYHASQVKWTGARTGSRFHANYFDNGPNGANQFLAPGDINLFYDVPSNLTGQGLSIAVIGQSDVLAADLINFRTGFLLPAIGSGCAANGSGIFDNSCSAPNFQVIYADNSAPGLNSGDLSESDLDLEWSNAVAPMAKLIFVTASPSSGNGVVDSFYNAIDNTLAPIISMSYGTCELNESAAGAFTGDNAELQKADTEGITFLVSTGDQGAAGCDTSSTGDPNNLALNGIAVQFPAASQYVTAVGGTGLPLSNGFAGWLTCNTAGCVVDPSDTAGYTAEQAWNDDSEFNQFCAGAGSGGNFCLNGNGTPGWIPITSQATAQADIGLSGPGGGPSNCAAVNGTVCTAGVPRPPWQSGLVITVSEGQIGGNAGAQTRLVPDIAGLASPNFPGYIVCVPQGELPGGSGTTTSCVNSIQDSIESFGSLIGGTSASTPVTAGIVADLSQSMGVTTGLGLINPLLYAIAPQTGPIHQITVGDNTMYCAVGDPVGQDANLLCPGTGIIGFFTSGAGNFDVNTGYNMATGLGTFDVGLMATAIGSFTPTTTTTALTLLPNQTTFYQGQPVTLTAVVTGTRPSGTVTFKSGTAVLSQLGVEVDNSGTATLMNPPLPIGSDVITATYNGDSANGGSLSAPQTVTVVAAFTLSAPATAVTQGMSTSPITVTVTPANGFNDALTFSCSIQSTATGATCTVTPTGPTTSSPTVTITTIAPSAMFHASNLRAGRMFYALLLPGLFGLILVGNSNRKGRVLMMLGFVAVLTTSTLWMSACSSSSSSHNTGTPKGMYTVTVNAVDATTPSITGSTTFTLTVQ